MFKFNPIHMRTLVLGALVAALSPQELWAQAPQIQLTLAFPELRFSNPVFITHAGDGSNRLFVVEQTGRIMSFENRAEVRETQVFLDLRSLVNAGGEEGLLGLAFDPEFQKTQKFYVYYSASNPRRSVIARYRTKEEDTRVADPASAEIILEIPQPFSNHNGGMLAFGADRMLYVALGDGGSGGDPQNHSQRKNTLLGKILRLDVRSSETYRIPEDNPFVADPSARGEIYAYGLRNPWRFSFDRVNNDLWAADVGQNKLEEINLIKRGGNYGWKIFEGTEVYDNPQNLPRSQFMDPIHVYGRSLGMSITGGYVYRGSQHPSLYGRYVYGDYVTGRIWALHFDGTRVMANDQIGRLGNLSSFGEDEAGELYLLSLRTGQVHRFQSTVPSGSANLLPFQDFPRRLSDTGFFLSTAELEVREDVRAYSVNHSFWSDGATKQRWFWIPPGKKIRFHPQEPWEFPEGSIFIKQLNLRVSPEKVRRLETRFFRKDRDSWTAVTYRWPEDSSDAYLVKGTFTEPIFVLDPLQGPRVQNWLYPSAGECALCHNDVAGTVLGLRTEQTNREAQLSRWDQEGIFDQPLASTENYPAYSALEDLSASLYQRSRSYLAVNCSVCHQPYGAAPGSMDMRFSSTLEELRLVNEDITEYDFDIPEAKRIFAGNKEKSILYHRLAEKGAYQMPPIHLGSERVDEKALEIIGEWINQGARADENFKR